jgi:membrane protease YdiL (CAAX protease family)
MRFLVEPGTVTMGTAQWVFLVALCLALPAAAIRQHRMLARSPLELTRPQVYVSGLMTHAVLLLLCWLAARGQPWGASLLTVGHDPTGLDVAIGAAALAIGIVPFLSRRAERAMQLDRTRLIAPRTAPEFGAFYTLSLSAGFAEELAYRGVLFALLTALTSSWWLAAVIASAAFGVAHLFQGWRPAGLAGVVALRDHIVVGLTGTLWVVIIVHMLHDIIAGTTIGLRARHEEERALALP